MDGSLIDNVGPYLARRLGQSMLVLFAVTVLSFALVYLSGVSRALCRWTRVLRTWKSCGAGFGLDQPVWVQYVRFVERAVQGDLGDSLKYRTNALELVLQRLPNTLLLASVSILLATVVAIPLGLLAATHRNGPLDYLATGLLMLAISTPTFWLGIVLILFLPERCAGCPRPARERHCTWCYPR